MRKAISETALLVSEADVKRAVEDRLQFAQNQGHLMYLRLNSGELIAVAGDTRRRIKLCPTGTADFVVFQGLGVKATYRAIIESPTMPFCRVTFLEIKSSKGKQSPEQGAFEILAKMFNCRYFIIRNADELEGILE